MRRWPVAALLAVSAVSSGAPGANAAPNPNARTVPRSLRSSVGVGAAKAWLRADSTEDRRRAFERLGAMGTARALELLARALDGGGAARDARERLVVVRALAPHAKLAAAQDALIRALSGLEGQPTERDELVERTAALALAASHHPLALAALARALRQPGRVSEDARVALRAHRPVRLEPLLEAAGAPTPALVELLGELGDARARPLLEHLAAKSAPDLKQRALAALYRVAPEAALPASHAALTHDGDPRVRAAATRVLALMADPGAVGALRALLADARTRAPALAIALEAPTESFGPVLAAVPSAEVDVDQLVAALGRTGGKAALGRLERELAQPENAWSAAYALALSTDPDAGRVLERALDRPATRRDAARAAVMRGVVHAARPSGLEPALDVLARGSPADRATSAWCRAVLDPERARAQFARGAAPLLLTATARQAFDADLAPEAARRLDAAQEPELKTALARALTVPAAADLVSTQTLLELYERGAAEGYLAAYALARRDTEALRPRVLEMLASADPTLRAHTALGLGQSEQPSAVGLLAAAYRAEVEPRVRAALVAALAARTERAREPTLELAAEFDPDDATRASARRALPRLGLDGKLPEPEGPGTAWLRLVPEPRSAGTVALVTTPDGLSLPLVADPDGSVTVTNLPRGELHVRVLGSASGDRKEAP